MQVIVIMPARPYSHDSSVPAGGKFLRLSHYRLR